MKMMKLIYPLAFALAVTLTSTGCHNRGGAITPLPGSATPNVGGDSNPQPIPSAPPFNPNDNLNGHDNHIATADQTLFDGMIEDRAALAAYTIHFAYDSAAIKKTEQSNLQLVAEALRADASTKLKIEGNCDERGTQEYNRSLGERRALAAREALAKLGIDPSRIVTISFGKDKPVDPANNEAAWAKNRRDDFVLLHPKAGG
jgi:peptidoglycan-associated lipoprotein